MDIFLIIFIVVLVILVGFILSRPFLSTDDQNKSPKTEVDYQYQELLKDIKSIQESYPPDRIPEEISKQLKEKKQAAANLLRLMNN